MTFGWLSSILIVGFSRPLEIDDLWELNERRKSSVLGPRLERNFYSRCPPEKRPRVFREQYEEGFTEQITVDEKQLGKEKPAREDSIVDSAADPEKGNPTTEKPDEESEEAKKRKKQFDESLIYALEKTFRRRFWMGGIVQFIGDALSTTSPLVTKALLQFLVESYYHARFPVLYPKKPPIGKGIGLAFGLFLMQQVASIAHNFGMAQTMEVGLLIRSTIIGQIFQKSLRLSGRARVEHSQGKITTMLSTDTTRLDFSLGFIHSLWISPCMIILALGLLIGNLGYSALVAVAVLLFGFPVQGALVKLMFNARKAGIKITDGRVRLIQEVVQGIRLVKIYAWESLYGHKVDELRRQELAKVRTTAIMRSTMISLTSFIPVLAAILSIITYALTGHDLNPAIIFSSLQMLN
ncbi:hypothetical protein FRC20_004408, partial [Serendipita sp. 405]